MRKKLLELAASTVNEIMDTRTMTYDMLTLFYIQVFETTLNY